MADDPHAEPRWSRLGQFCAANNIAVPPSMTATERAAWERREDEADAAVERLYGLGNTAAA